MKPKVLGIDVSKRKLDVTLIVNEKASHKVVSNDRKGFCCLYQWLQTRECYNIHVCMESTGIYSQSVAKFLHTKGYKVSVVNPLMIKAFGKSKLIRTKTDAADALLIAKFAQVNELRLWNPPNQIQQEIKELYGFYNLLNKELCMINNQLECKEQKGKYLMQACQQTSNSLKQQITNLKSNLLNLVHSDEQLVKNYELLLSIPGIGSTTAIAILALIPDINNFCSARQLAAFTGLTPYHHQSGSSVRGKSSLSRIGNKDIRAALYWPAISAKNHNLLVKSFVQSMHEKHKHNMSIICAVMRKLIHIIFGVLKHQTPFNPNL